MRQRLRLLVAAVACVVVACGEPVSPVTPAPTTTASATTTSTLTVSPTNLLPPLAAGTACGVYVTGGPPPPTPVPTAPRNAPSWAKVGVGGPVSTIAWSPDGTLLATTPGQQDDTDDTAHLWTADGADVATLSGNTASVRCLAWSPDSQTVASAGADGSVRMWDRSGRLVRVLPGVNPLFSLAWSPDGKVLAVGAIAFPGPTATGPAQLPGIVTLWRPDGTRLHTVGTHGTGGKFLNLAWSPDGSLLAAGAVDYADWHADGRPIAVLPSGDSPAWAMAWAPDGLSLAVGDESGDLVLDGPAGDVLGAAHFTSDVNALSYSPDGHGLAVGLNDRLQFVHPDDPEKVVWSAFTADGAGRVAWAPDGQRLAIAVTDGLDILRLDGSATAALSGCPGAPVAFAWAGSAIAAMTDQGRLCAWKAP